MNVNWKFIQEFICRFVIGSLLLYFVNNNEWYDVLQYIIDLIIIFWITIPILENNEKEQDK